MHPKSQQDLQSLNQRLSEVAAKSAEIIVSIDEKNRQLARANAHAAELVAEIQVKNQEIARLNRSLAEANATASELVAENELKSQQLQHLNTQLRDALENKSKWIGFAAHDLRGGIGSILGLAGFMAQESNPDPADMLESAGLIGDECNRLLNLLTSLLETVRIDQGRVSLSREPMDLVQFTHEALEFHARIAETKHLRLTEALPRRRIMVTADPARLRQVADNLLSNAIKFSMPGGKIEVGIRPRTDGVEWYIHDCGPGLAPGDFPELFHSFRKLTAQPTGGEPSHGLGLALSRSLIELHGGKISGRNSPSGGAIFSFFLPNEEA